jgi:hypothetical protein
MHDLQFRSEHFRSVPKTCRTAGHRLNLPEAGAELSEGSIFRWCVSVNFSKAGPTTGTPRAGLAKIAQDRAADAALGTGLLLFSLRAGYWRRGAGTATAHIGLYCRGVRPVCWAGLSRLCPARRSLRRQELKGASPPICRSSSRPIQSAPQSQDGKSARPPPCGRRWCSAPTSDRMIRRQYQSIRALQASRSTARAGRPTAWWWRR